MDRWDSKELQGRAGPREVPDPLAVAVYQVYQVHLDSPEPQDSLVVKDLLVQAVLRVLLDLQEQLEILALLDRLEVLVLPGSPGPLGRRVRSVLLAVEDFRDSLEQRDQPVHLERQDQLEDPVPPGLWVSLDLKVLQVLRDLSDRRRRLEHLVCLALMVLQVLRDSREATVRRALQAQPDPRDRQARLVQLDQRDHQGTKALLVSQV